MVSQSTREIGIRLAMGAGDADVLRHVFGRAARLFVPGAILGITGAPVFGQLLRSWLFGIPHDPVSMAAVLGLLAAVAGIAAWLPARRALRIQPQEALRYR